MITWSISVFIGSFCFRTPSICTSTLYHVRTIFWHKLWRGVVLHLLHRFKRFNLQEADKIFGFRFLAGQTDIRLRSQKFLRAPMKAAKISGVLFASFSHAPKRGKKCDEFKSLYQNILEFLFCGHISLLQRKQHHLKFHLTWARGPQFGQGPVLAVHLSESVSSFARNFPTWKQIYSTAQGSNTIVQFVF